MPKQKKKRHENIQNAPCSTAIEEASCHPDTPKSGMKTAAQKKPYPPNLKKISSTVCPQSAEGTGDMRPKSTTTSKLNDQASISSDKADSSKKIESLSQSQADRKSAVQKSRKASRKGPYDKDVLKAQVKNHKALSKERDAEPLHHQKSYEQVKLNCRKIIVGTLQKTAIQCVILSLYYFDIKLGKNTSRVRLKTTEFTKWTYGFARKKMVTFLRITIPAYRKLQSRIKWDRKEVNPWNHSSVTNPKEQEIILIFEVCCDSDTHTIIETIITNIGVRNNIPDFCVKIPFKEVNHVLKAFKKSTGETSRKSEGKHNSKSKRQPRNEKRSKALDDGEGIVYPPPPAKGSIIVTNEDLQCLNEGEYLNDIIIDFYLKYLMLEKLKKKDAERTHVFSCFFYTCLNEKQRGNFQEASELTIQQQRHNRVKRWTRDVDIFEKDFIFVPVNEDEHWFLAVICFPSLTKPEYERNPYSKKIRTSTICKQSSILVMDSLKSSYPSHVFRILQEWLEEEWVVKKGTNRSFSGNVMKSFNLEVPQQYNSSDCGIYMLQFVESFFESPILNFDRPVNLTDWFPYTRVDNKREEIRNIILSLQ